MTVLLALLGCDGPTRADYERLERRIEVLEARERERVAAANPDPVDPAAERMDRMQGELALLGKPAPALTVTRWLRGDGDRASGKAPYLLVFFPVASDSAVPLRRVATLAAARDLPVLGVARGATVEGAEGWLSEVDLPFAVALDAEEATTTAYRRSAAVSAVLVKDGIVVWTGTPAGLDEAVLRKHL